MAIDATAPHTRRAVLAATLGGLAATVASALGRPGIVHAGSDGDVVLGTTNTSTNATYVRNSAGGTAFVGAVMTGLGSGLAASSDAGAGVHSLSNTGDGVYGESQTAYGIHGYGVGNVAVYGESPNHPGVVGHSDTSFGVSGTSPDGTGVSGSSGTASGVSAFSNATAAPAAKAWSAGNSTGLLGYSGDSAPAAPANTGVYGEANQDKTARGVFGKTTVGQAVRGQAGAGIAGYFTSTGTALQTSGKVKLNRSGKASIPANASSVDVTVPGGLAGTPLPFANLQTYRAGVFVAAIQPNYPSTGVMRIYLNKVASTTGSTPVAWMVLS